MLLIIFHGRWIDLCGSALFTLRVLLSQRLRELIIRLVTSLDSSLNLLLWVRRLG